MTSQPAKQYAKQICEYLKKLPEKFADDPQDVQDALGLSDEEFKMGVDWCVARKLITLDKAASSPAPAATASAPAPAASASPFVMDEDETEDETVGDRESVFGAKAEAETESQAEPEPAGVG